MARPRRAPSRCAGLMRMSRAVTGGAGAGRAIRGLGAGRRRRFGGRFAPHPIKRGDESARKIIYLGEATQLGAGVIICPTTDAIPFIPTAHGWFEAKGLEMAASRDIGIVVI